MIDSNPKAVDFLGYEIDLVRDDDGKPYVPLKRLCEILGIDHKWEIRKVKREDIFEGRVLDVPSKGGTHRKTFCLPFGDLYWWLFTVDTNIVRPEIIDKVIDYKRESSRALRNYETRGEAVNPDRIVLSYEDLDKVIDSVVHSTMKMIRERIMKQFYWSDLSELSKVHRSAKTPVHRQ